MLLTSDWYQAMAKSMFCQEILEDARDLVRACGEGNVEEARELLSNGMVDVNYQDSYYRKPCKRGRTPLHFAAIHGKKELVQLLIINGANVKIADDSGKTPLHKAASHGKKEMTEILAANGADVNRADVSGRTPLHESALNGHCRVVKLLLANSAEVNKADNSGKTPLHEAVKKGRKEVAKILIDKIS